MSSKIALTKPTLILLYGFPGSGKTFFARQFAENAQVAHIEGDRIRHELFEQPQHDKQENMIVNHLMEYMAETFLLAGVSVIYDTNAFRLSQRRALRDMARRIKAEHVLIWLQIDPESAIYRASKRDHRKADDKYAVTMDDELFDGFGRAMQNPENEDYIVISGKHTFNAQRSSVMKRLLELKLINTDSAAGNIIKPELVNLVTPAAGGRVDMARRNIIIR